MSYKNSKNRGIYLIGTTNETLTGAKLPSNRQILGRFLHLHLKDNISIQKSAHITTNELLDFWNKARIPTKQNYNIVNQIKKLHLKWIGIKKNANRQTETQVIKMNNFVNNLDDLFDVAHANAMNLIKLQEDKEFLKAQREKGRRGSMGALDTKLLITEKKCIAKNLKIITRKRKESERLEIEKHAVLNISNSSSSEKSTSDSDEEVKYNILPKCTRKRPRNIINRAVASALDRTKISDRNATYILAATAETIGLNTSEIALNKETIRRMRRTHRENIAKEIRQDFQPEVALTVHWDGKILSELMSKESVDRLAVLVSGEGVMKLLGVPKLTRGTGEEQANAIFQLLNEWNIVNRVNFMCFDTTASNTGIKRGACTILQQKIGRNLLGLACRHHIFEIIISKVFNSLPIEHQSGPDLLLFKTFSKFWKNINKESYESAMSDDSISFDIILVKNDIINFIRNQLSVYQPRDHYKEMLALFRKRYYPLTFSVFAVIHSFRRCRHCL